MNCPRCNAPLLLDARFCQNCGLSTPASARVSQNMAVQSAAYLQPAADENTPTVPLTPQQPTQLESRPPLGISPVQAYYQATQPVAAPVPFQGPAMVLSAVETSPKHQPKRQRRRRSWLLRSLVSLFVLVIVLLAGWFLALRPYLNNLARTQIDQVLGSLVNRISLPAQAALLPTCNLTVTQNGVNSLIVLNTAPADTVKKIHVTITPSVLQLDFQVNGYGSTITGVPMVQKQNNQLVITNVQISGLASLILSSDDIMMLVNKHLMAAQVKLGHPILDEMLSDGALVLTLGGISAATNPPTSCIPIP